jgi:hypothetical protein
LLLCYIVVAVGVGTLTRIQATRINDREIRLTNVSPEFVAAVEKGKSILPDGIDCDVGERWLDRLTRTLGDDQGYRARDDQSPPQSTDFRESNPK